MNTQTQTQRRTVYQVVTDKIIGELEQGRIPWEKPWTNEPPRNLVSGKAYRGINVFLLGASGYGSPWWVTYKQATARGGNVRKGEHGSLIVFWKWPEKPTRKDEDEDETRADPRRGAPMLRYYVVFNAEQCEGIAAPATRAPVPSLDAAEAIAAGYPNPPRREQGAQASYSIGTDTVTMPARSSFTHAGGYYSTLFHELTHSTRHGSRLNRGSGKPNAFGGEEYSQEELVAEMGAAMLCGQCGLTATARNSEGYIQHWLEVLHQDSRLVVLAAAQAQKAADYVLGAPAVAAAA